MSDVAGRGVVPRETMSSVFRSCVRVGRVYVSFVVRSSGPLCDQGSVAVGPDGAQAPALQADEKGLGAVLQRRGVRGEGRSSLREQRCATSQVLGAHVRC